VYGAVDGYIAATARVDRQKDTTVFVFVGSKFGAGLLPGTQKRQKFDR
jgi:hypothetical protein